MDRCEGCGQFLGLDELSVESFELTGRLLCEECTEDAMEDFSLREACEGE